MPNKKNLKPLQERTAEERKEIARKGGKASAIKRKETKEQEQQIKSVIELLTSNDYLMKETNVYDLFGYDATEEEKKKSKKIKNISIIDYGIYSVFSLLSNTNASLQPTRLNVAKFFYQIQQDEINRKEIQQDKAFKRELAIRELELKEKQLDLEERKLKLKENILKRKDRESIVNDMLVIEGNNN